MKKNHKQFADEMRNIIRNNVTKQIGEQKNKSNSNVCEDKLLQKVFEEKFNKLFGELSDD